MKQILFLMLLLLFSCNQTNEQNEQFITENEDLRKKVDSLTEVIAIERKPMTVENDSLTDGTITSDNESNYWFNATYDRKEFIKSGIEDPAEFIKNALRKRPELIPLKAVLGGTMRFGNIQILSDKWLIADFNDGHIEGKALYKYELKSNNTMEYQLLEMTSHSQ